jgi:hypothetical protein
MATNDGRFPPIGELDDLPFMRGMHDFKKLRADNITLTHDAILNSLNELPDFAGVADEAKEYLARRLAVHVERMYETGYQGGIDDRKAADQARADEDRRFKFNSIGN